MVAVVHTHTQMVAIQYHIDPLVPVPVRRIYETKSNRIRKINK